MTDRTPSAESDIRDALDRYVTVRDALATVPDAAIERLTHDLVELIAERDALCATVDRLRSVVEALADGCREAAASDAKEDPDGAAQELFDSLSSALGLGFDAADFLDIERALRALLADAPADIGEVLERGADADGAALDALGIAPAGVPDVG